MSHSGMLKIRRTKQSTKKQLAGVAKRAKRLKHKVAKTGAAGAAKGTAA